MKRLAVMTSGGGSNLQALMDAIEEGRINGKIVLVIANNQNAYALTRAAKKGIDTLVIAKSDFADEQEFFEENLKALQKYQVDGVVLAGYMSILGQNIIAAYPNRMINIHPALIPSFCGKGYYGHHVHQAVLDYGVKVTGATVHFVDDEADHGPIILQEAVPVYEDDTPETLADRVLTVEHILLPKAVALFCEDKLCVKGRMVHILK